MMRKLRVLIFAISLLSACATAHAEPTSTKIHPTSTHVPPTATPAPPTGTPEPTSCEEVEGNCLELSFDGESCTYEGPMDLKTGPVTLLFLNESETNAYAGLVRLTGDKTVQDFIDYNGEEPSTRGAPTWVQALYAYRDVPTGESNTWEGFLEPGIHTIVCGRVLPHGVWFGTGLTVDN